MEKILRNLIAHKDCIATVLFTVMSAIFPRAVIAERILYVMENEHLNRLAKVTMGGGILEHMDFWYEVEFMSIDYDKETRDLYLACSNSANCVYKIPIVGNTFGIPVIVVSGVQMAEGIDVSEVKDQFFVGSYDQTCKVLRFNRDGTNKFVYYSMDFDHPRSVFFCEAENKLYVAPCNGSSTPLARCNYDSTGFETGVHAGTVYAAIFVHKDGYITRSSSNHKKLIKSKFDGTNATELGGFNYIPDFDYDPDSGYYYVIDHASGNDRIIKTKLDGSGWTIRGLDTSCYRSITLGSMEPSSVEEAFAIDIREAKLAVYPNPFAKQIIIRYSLPGDPNEVKTTRLTIYDISGRVIKKLVDKRQAPGYYAIKWGDINNKRKEAHSGIYFVKLEIGGGVVKMKKLVMIR